MADPSAIVWRGDPHLPPEEQGINIFGTPLGHPSYVRYELAALTAKHEHLINIILQVKDLQSVWILLFYCASARVNYSLRVVYSKLTDAFADQHDASMHKALSQLLSVDPGSMYWDVASLPFTRGGMVLRSAALISGEAYLSSWADCLEMISARNPDVADMIVTEMGQADAGFHVSGASEVREQLVRVRFNYTGECRCPNLPGSR